MLYTKFQGSTFLRPGVEDFQGFFSLYKGMATILVSRQEQFEQTLVPPTPQG